MFIFLNILFLVCLIFPTGTFASPVDLNKCIEISHCVREEWDVSLINEPFTKVREIIDSTPRSKIVQNDDDYIHSEVTSKWMRYVDDLEVSYLPLNNKLLIRSESRVGESDLGVNKKRVDLIKSKLFYLD